MTYPYSSNRRIGAREEVDELSESFFLPPKVSLRSTFQRSCPVPAGEYKGEMEMINHLTYLFYRQNIHCVPRSSVPGTSTARRSHGCRERKARGRVCCSGSACSEPLCKSAREDHEVHILQIHYLERMVKGPYLVRKPANATLCFIMTSLHTSVTTGVMRPSA